MARFQFVRIGTFDLPVPADWQITSNNRSYEGEAGLVDPRLVVSEAPIDQRRVELMKETFSAGAPSVRLVEIHGRTSLFCQYTEEGCPILSYVIPEEDGLEIRVAYVIRAGYEDLIDEIHAILVGGD